MKKIAALIIMLSTLLLSACQISSGSNITDLSHSTENTVTMLQSESFDISSQIQSSSAVTSKESTVEFENEAFNPQSNASVQSEVIPEGKDLTDKIKFEGEIDPNKPAVCLTFDDGPTRRGTNAILDILEKYGVVATFFDAGYNVELYPEVVQREVALGCEIGSHTYSHIDLDTLSPAKVKEEIEKANSTFENAVGFVPLLIRPPFGRCRKEIAETLDQAIIRWSVDTLDWKTENAEMIFAEITAQESLDGKCILMHSIYEETAAALDLIIPYLQNKGYQFVTVSQMITKVNGDSLVAGKTYGYSYFNGRK